MRAEHIGGDNVFVKQAVSRMAFLFKGIEGKGDIVGGDGGVIMKLRDRPEVEFHPLALIINCDGFCKQPVNRIRFVIGASHQLRKVEEAIAALVAIDQRRIAFQQEGIDGIEAIQVTQLDCSAFRGIGINILEMREIRAVFQISEDGQPVTRNGFCFGICCHQ